MFKLFVCATLLTGMAACGARSNENGSAAYTNDPAYKKGLALVAKNNCFNCHAVSETITGPAYRDIGKRYEQASDSMVSVLGSKIIAGGTGVWGSAIMIPHPGVSQEDAEAMVRYIMLLGKNAQ